MSSPEDNSPTDSAPRGNKDNGSNGFTAVNGRSASPPPAKQARFSEDANGETRARPQLERPVNGESSHRRFENSEANGSVSPLNTPVKRKRDESSDNEDENDSGDEGDASPAEGESSRMDFDRDASAEGRPSGWNNNRQQSLDSSDVQLVAALSKENGTNDGSENEAQEDQNFVTTKAGVQVTTIKRKRAFTNRTKTGCQTCRRRKKKCDEQKPECQNCLRGGFKCEGYSAQKTVPKPPPSARNNHMPIQAKDGYGDTGGIYPRPPRMEQMPRQPVNGYPVAPVPQAHRQFSHDDDVHNPSRQWRNASAYQPGPSQRYPTDRRSTDGLPNTNGIHPGYEHQYNVPSVMARQALNTIQPGSRPANRSEKDKMIDGHEYCPFDPILVKDREVCRIHLDRYNNNTSVSREERERQLRSVVEPETRPPSSFASLPSHLGKNVIVEAPFICEYGYNIYLHDNVIIERGCEIQDACEVSIGKGVYIGANVKIVTKTVPYRAEERFSTQMRLKGVRVHIGDGVHIGTGCVIVPDFEQKEGILVIGSGSYIKPFTCVRADVTANTVFGVLDRDGPKNMGNIEYWHDLSRPRG